MIDSFAGYGLSCDSTNLPYPQPIAIRFSFLEEAFCLSFSCLCFLFVSTFWVYKVCGVSCYGCLGLSLLGMCLVLWLLLLQSNRLWNKRMMLGFHLGVTLGFRIHTMTSLRCKVPVGTLDSTPSSVRLVFLGVVDERTTSSSRD